MSILITKPAYAKHFNAVASSNILLKLANPRFSNLRTNTHRYERNTEQCHHLLGFIEQTQILSRFEERYPQGNLLT